MIDEYFFSFSLSLFRLSQHSRNLFFDLGSATIQNLKYRDVWVLVGQKGIKGFSPYEEVCYDRMVFFDVVGESGEKPMDFGFFSIFPDPTISLQDQ